MNVVKTLLYFVQARNFAAMHNYQGKALLKLQHKELSHQHSRTDRQFRLYPFITKLSCILHQVM